MELLLFMLFYPCLIDVCLVEYVDLADRLGHKSFYTFFKNKFNFYKGTKNQEHITLGCTLIAAY